MSDRQLLPRRVWPLTKGVKRLGIEFDHINLDTMALLKSEFPDMEFVDIAQPAIRQRMIKSEEEIAHITKMTRIADIGGAACCEATQVGVGEHEVALHATSTMVKEIAKVWPHGELMYTWTGSSLASTLMVPTIP
jgi:creatinase